MRITVDLAKASTEPVDLTGVLNPRVGDGDLKLPFHLMYNGDDEDMRGKSMYQEQLMNQQKVTTHTRVTSPLLFQRVLLRPLVLMMSIRQCFG